MNGKKLAMTVAAGAFTTAFVGGVALAGFQPFASADGAVVGGPTAAFAGKDQPKDKLKAVLDALVAKNAISQAQEDAILQAIKDAAPTPKPKPNVPNPKPARPSVPNVMSFLGDLT